MCRQGRLQLDTSLFLCRPTALLVSTTGAGRLPPTPHSYGMVRKWQAAERGAFEPLLFLHQHHRHLLLLACLRIPILEIVLLLYFFKYRHRGDLGKRGEGKPKKSPGVPVAVTVHTYGSSLDSDSISYSIMMMQLRQSLRLPLRFNRITNGPTKYSPS